MEREREVLSLFVVKNKDGREIKYFVCITISSDG